MDCWGAENGSDRVAIATVISQAVGVVAMLIVMLTGLNQKFSFRDLVPLPWEILRDILKIGLPSAGEGIAYEASQLTITRIITVLGKVALTTRVYTLNIMYFVMVFSVAVGQGTQIVVGHLVGAGDNEKAYKTCIKSLRYLLWWQSFLRELFRSFRSSFLESLRMTGL